MNTPVHVHTDLREYTPLQAYEMGVQRGLELAKIEQTGKDIVRILDYAAQLTRYRYCMSYDSSYFGEPAGWLKQVTREIELKLPPAYIVHLKAAASNERPD